MKKPLGLLLVGFLATACGAEEAQLEARIAAGVRATLTAEAAPQAQGTSAQVARIIDGDTIEVRTADGQTFSVRYIGINAPEREQPCGAEATQANAQLVAGQWVTLVRDVSEVDRYGRWLRYVYRGDLLINAELVRTGYASAATYPPDVALAEEFARLEAEARTASRGCWTQTTGEATGGQASGEIVIDPTCSQFDAPGNDNQNLAEEYVCFTHQGTAALDLSGWSLRDEHGWTYTLPTFTLQPGSSVRLHTGCGTDSERDLFWCKSDGYAVWNNGGDAVLLMDSQGLVVAEYSY